MWRKKSQLLIMELDICMCRLGLPRLTKLKPLPRFLLCVCSFPPFHKSNNLSIYILFLFHSQFLYLLFYFLYIYIFFKYTNLPLQRLNTQIDCQGCITINNWFNISIWVLLKNLCSSHAYVPFYMLVLFVPHLIILLSLTRLIH